MSLHRAPLLLLLCSGLLAAPVEAQREPADSVRTPSTSEVAGGVLGSLLGSIALGAGGAMLTGCDLIEGSCHGLLPGAAIGGVLGSAAGVHVGARRGEHPYSFTGAAIGAVSGLALTALIGYGMHRAGAPGPAVVVMLTLPLTQGITAANESRRWAGTAGRRRLSGRMDRGWLSPGCSGR